MTATLADKTRAVARILSVTSFSPKAFISDVYKSLVALGDVSDDLTSYKTWLVVMHRKGLLSLSRCDMAPAFDPIKVRASETRIMGAEFHFIRG